MPLRHTFEKHGKKRCNQCKTLQPIEHFVKIVGKSGKIQYRCKNKILEKTKLKVKTKNCDICKKRFTLDHFISYTYNTGRTVLKCKQNFDKVGLNTSKKGKKQPRTKSLDYKLYSSEYEKDRRLQRDYGLSLADYNNMLLIQGGCCAICKRDSSLFMKSLFVDHCHTTMKIRGLLCYNCNMAIGLLNDNIQSAQNVTEYLIKNSSTNE